MDTKDSVIDELAIVKACLKKALTWWHDEAEFLTTGEHGDNNVFDDDPAWVGEANKALAPVIEVPSNIILLRAGSVVLTQGDVDILDGSKSRSVRLSIEHDTKVKELYDMWKSL